jgi:hypothetical protein
MIWCLVVDASAHRQIVARPQVHNELTPLITGRQSCHWHRALAKSHQLRRNVCVLVCCEVMKSGKSPRWTTKYFHRILVPIMLLPTLFAKNVLGMDEFLYRNEKDPDAKAVIEVTSDTVYFETSTKNRIVEFYSPYCVRRYHRPLKDS